MTNKTEKDVWIEMSIREISTQAHFANLAYQNIESKANENNGDVIFPSIHSFLSHCANISKLLQASDYEKISQKTCSECSHVTITRKSSKTIGDILNISSDSDIHKRKFRNHLEHYDERLKIWIKKWVENKQANPNFEIGTYNLGQKNNLPNTLKVTHYDSHNKIFTFIDEDFDLQILHKEAQRIQTLADKWVREN